ncbi:MAG: ATP-dependent sacrificial sulfur transferase LarE [Chloroflexi bacterium]|nr:ATP-dependent sacrificial sulfur transferase LarE [Chloroflexota bacterium]
MITLDSVNQKLSSAGISPELNRKWQALLQQLSSFESVAIAYSGGVDSSFLAYAAALVLDQQAVAVTINSSIEPSDVIERAREFTHENDIRHEFITYDPLLNPNFRDNPVDRCYHCKTAILHMIWKYARDHQIKTVLEGQNADDGGDYRPGRKAVRETGTFSPLAEQSLSKDEIRWIAKTLGLPIWDQPSSPCLASRVPYGMQITREALQKIAAGEHFLHEKGFRTVRVRYHKDLARIEVPPEQIPSVLEIHQEVTERFKQLGFLYVTVDLQGFRSGSLNEGIAQ